MLDGRSTRHHHSRADDAGKSMLGAEQKAWLKSQFDWLAQNADRIMIWANTMPWIGDTPAGDDWSQYQTERDELVDYFTGVTGGADVSSRIVMISGDMHALAYDDGSNAPGRIHVCHAAPMGNSNSQKGGPYLDGPYTSSQRQYGMLDVVDEAGSITVRFTGYRADSDAVVLTSGDIPMIEVLPDEPGKMDPPTLDLDPSGEIEVSFLPPDHTGSSAITSYDIRHSEDEGNWTIIAEVSGSPEVLIGVDPHTDHWIQVRAINSHGPGPWSVSAKHSAVPSGDIVVQWTMDGSFDDNYPSVYSNIQVNNGNLSLSSSSWAGLSVSPGGIGVQKTKSHPKISLPIPDLPAGNYEIKATALIGVGFLQYPRNWTDSGGLFVGVSTDPEFIPTDLKAAPNDPDAPYAADITLTWDHDGTPDMWIIFHNNNARGSVSGGDIVLAGILIIERIE